MAEHNTGSDSFSDPVRIEYVVTLYKFGFDTGPTDQPELSALHVPVCDLHKLARLPQGRQRSNNHNKSSGLEIPPALFDRRAS